MEEQAPSAPTISFSDIVVNVFASPADAYEGIRTSPTRASIWVVPLIVLMLLSCCFTWLMFTNESMKSQFMDSQRTRMEEQVQAGKISQEQADRGLEQMEKSGGMLIAFGIIGGILMIGIMFFLAALIFWLIGRFGLKAEAGYGKYLELYGAAQWIGILGFIVTILIGIVGAFLGGFLGNLITGTGLNGFSLWSIVLAIVGSLILLWIYRMTTRSRGTTTL